MCYVMYLHHSGNDGFYRKVDSISVDMSGELKHQLRVKWHTNPEITDFGHVRGIGIFYKKGIWGIALDEYLGGYGDGEYS